MRLRIIAGARSFLLRALRLQSKQKQKDVQSSRNVTPIMTQQEIKNLGIYEEKARREARERRY
jgi:hypothetical protein